MTMTMTRFTLDLPCGISTTAAVDQASAALRDQRISRWTKLELYTTLTTADAGTCRFTFTYWHEE